MIPVPYPNTPEISEDQWNSGDYESLLVLPPEGWSLVFGCRECGHLGTYGANDVGEGIIERVNRASFHNGTNCFSVKLQCARIECKISATMHVNLQDGEAEKDLLRLLKTSFFDGLLPCGHPFLILTMIAAYSESLRNFFRARFRAKACFTRRFSPGFR
jgi:hypothetical protein